MIGVKIEFKGRINRWRRTKILRGVGGLLPSLYDYKTKVEYGSSKSITRKGALGIRLWFCYKSYFTTILRRAILKYFLYSKYLHLYTIKKFLHKYKSI
jgi:ribosomal protein S3